MATYAEEELQKFVTKLRLSKETADALRSLPPAVMLSVMVEQKGDGQGEGDAAETGDKAAEINADGAEDIVVMARIARAREESAAGSSTTKSSPNVPGGRAISSDAAQAAFAKMVEESAKASKGATTTGAVEDLEDSLLIALFVKQNGSTIALEHRLKELPSKVLRQVVGKPGTAQFQVKNHFRDPDREVFNRIERALRNEEPSAPLSKDAKEVDAKIREKIAGRAHTMEFAQSIVGFVGKLELGKNIERALMMLSQPQVKDITNDRVLAAHLAIVDKEKKQEAVLMRAKKHDKQVYGLVKAFMLACDASAKKATDKESNFSDKADKRTSEKKRSPEVRKKSPEPRKKSPVRKKTPERKKSPERKKTPERKKSPERTRRRDKAVGREQHRKSRSARREKSRSVRRARDRRRSRSPKRRSRSPPRKRKPRSKTPKKIRSGKSQRKRGNSSSGSRSRSRGSSSGDSSPGEGRGRRSASRKVGKEKLKTVAELREMARGTAIPNYRELLTRLYQEHNPTKLAAVGQLMEKYAGQEGEMYVRVCKKYGVAPAHIGGAHWKLDSIGGAAEAGAGARLASDGQDDSMGDLLPALAHDDGGPQDDEPALEEQCCQEDVAPEEPAKATLATSVAAAVPGGPQSEDERPVWEWLRGLDNGHGALCRYFEVLRREFDADFSQIAAARLPTPISPGTLGSIDPSFFEVLGVVSAGHRLLLAKGIMALPA